ncbi:MAG: DNA-binding protein [Proteobacteria bacterium]|nr:HU family DNA-binding protein [Gammaproteobacteria bacterium]MYB88568.1 DNA-binding protein [Pseudomonadota bacterium]
MATSRPDKKPPTKTAILNGIAKETDLSRKQVASVLESLEGMIAKELRPRGAGSFNLPGLLKIKVVKKPAKRARKGVNPFTGEEMTFKAKPASKSVRVLPLKKLKSMV